MKLELIAITTDKKAMQKYLDHEFCIEVYNVYEKLYAKIGFHIPWIGYFSLLENTVVGVGGYKGSPTNNKIEIAYGVVPEEEGRGFATKICQQLIKIALNEDPDIRVLARTLMEENASTNILKKCNFKFIGIMEDPEDGRVWEWELDDRAFCA